jgi:hypothetical protein
VSAGAILPWSDWGVSLCSQLGTEGEAQPHSLPAIRPSWMPSRTCSTLRNECTLGVDQIRRYQILRLGLTLLYHHTGIALAQHEAEEDWGALSAMDRRPGRYRYRGRTAEPVESGTRRGTPR